jgi:hypothetical protein
MRLVPNLKICWTLADKAEPRKDKTNDNDFHDSDDEWTLRAAGM